MPDDRLHVVFVDHVARLSGGEIALLRLLPELSHRVDVTVILGEHGPLEKRLLAAGVRTEVLPLPSRVRDLRKETVRARTIDLKAIASLPRYIVALRRRIRQLNPDIVHTNSLKAALYAGVAGRLAGVPTIWHVRDRISDDYLPKSAVHLVRLLSRFLPAAVIANSHETMSTLPRRWHSNVLYNPILPDVVDARSRLRRSGNPGLIVGMIGRLTPWKGQDIFLDAFAEAYKGSAARGRLIGSALFGEDAYADSLITRAKRLGISEQVEFRGFREDVFTELRELDMVVHCSVRPEPFGQVVLEGLAAGVPVIAANAGGPAELITSGVDGILTTPGDPHELAAAMLTLSSDWVIRAKIGAAGRRRARDFAPDKVVDELLGFYADALRER